MDQIKILFVDVDEEYLMRLVMKFIDALEDKVDITMITELDYLNQYLEEPHEINILVIKDSLYGKQFERFSINDVYILTENVNSDDKFIDARNLINKYSSIGHIYTKIASLSGLDKIDTSNNQKGKLVMVYSPIGGSGKTYTALGIARALADLNKRVLYLNVESVQNFEYYLNEKGFLPKEFEQAMIRQEENLIKEFKNTIRREEFDYLPPLEQSTIALNITLSSYKQLIASIKELNLYDYIVVETSSEFNQDNVVYMGMADKVIIVACQDYLSTFKLERFLTNIDYVGQDKFNIVCNLFDDKKQNCLTDSTKKKAYDILEYITVEEKSQDIGKTRDKYVEGGFQKIAYYLL
ncbi:AAA family ATPase [Anaerosporobacter sp.]